MVKEDLQKLTIVLQTYPAAEIESFWYFLFDGPHPAETFPIDINQLRSIDSQMATIAEKAFEKVHNEVEPHGN